MTVFSTYVNISVGGTTLDPVKVSGLKLRFSSDSGDLFSGFINGSMEFSYHGDCVFPPNAGIELHVTGSCTINAEGYRISRIRRKGRCISIYARDGMRELERPVDVSLYDRDSRVESSLAVTAIAAACGFSGAANIPQAVLCYDDLAGKTAREVLYALSVIGCGVWYRSLRNELVFAHYGTAGTQLVCPESAVFYEHSRKGAISCVKGYSTETKKYFVSGSGDYTKTISVRGSMLTAARVSAILGAVAGKYIRSFYCGHIPCAFMPSGSISLLRNGTEYFPLETVICICSAPYMDMKYPDICEDEFEYTDRTEYSVREKLSPMTVYGSALITEKGVGILESGDTDDIRSRSAHYFGEAKGAVTRFSGAVMDTKMPVSITDISPTRKRISYDSVSYILNYTKTASGKTNITLTEEEQDRRE